MTFVGNDNHGKPKAEYLAKIAAMNDTDFRAACEQMIWLSAYAANNPRSDYHWQCDACCEESERRKSTIYGDAHKAVMQREGYG